MPENITIVNQELYNFTNRFVGRKPAKMGEAKVVSIRHKASLYGIKNPKVEPVKEEVKVSNDINFNQNNINLETPKRPEIKNVTNDNIINFPSKEVYAKRLENQGVVCYNNLMGNLNLEASRRLRVNNLVAKVNAHVTNLVGIDYPKVEKEEQPMNEIKETNPFDFSSFNTVIKETPKENKIVQIEDYWNKEKVNKVETPISKPISISTNDEINSLAKENNNLRQSLETQKEILADMKRKIDEYNLMSQSKKQELEEENLALTQELNDVLAEINKLNSIANEQEAFLGIAAGNENSYQRR